MSMRLDKSLLPILAAGAAFAAGKLSNSHKMVSEQEQAIDQTPVQQNEPSTTPGIIPVHKLEVIPGDMGGIRIPVWSGATENGAEYSIPVSVIAFDDDNEAYVKMEITLYGDALSSKDEYFRTIIGCSQEVLKAVKEQQDEDDYGIDPY